MSKFGIVEMMNSTLLWIFTVFSLASFFGILWGADPYSSGFFIRTLFFLALFFSLTGMFSLLGLFVAKLKRKPHALEATFRRAVLLAALAASVTVLETFSILNIWNAFAAFLFVVSLEMLAIYKK